MHSDLSVIHEWLTLPRPLSRRTYTAYEREAERFLAWLQKASKSMATCSHVDIEAYLSALQICPQENQGLHTRRRKALSASSLVQSRRILGLIFSWANREGYIPKNPIRLASRKQEGTINNGKTSAYNHGIDTKAVLGQCEGDDSEESLRARTIAHLAFWLGATSSEIADLVMDSVVEINGKKFLSFCSLRTDDEKHLLEIPKETQRLMHTYIQLRIKKGQDISCDAPLIASLRGGGKVSAWTVWHALQEWDDLPSNSPRLTPQQLRRKFQNAAINEGVQERELAAYLRRHHVVSSPIPWSQVNTKRIRASVYKALKG
jgi:site-specific recombinase XerD